MNIEQQAKLDREDMESGAEMAERVAPMFAETLNHSHDQRLWWMGFYSAILAYTVQTTGEDALPSVSHVVELLQNDYAKKKAH